MRAEIEKLKSQQQNDRKNDINNVIEKTVAAEIIRVSKMKHIEDRATAILMDEIRQIGGAGHSSMMMSVESKYEPANSSSDAATELDDDDDDLSQSLDDRKSLGIRNIPSTMSKRSTTPMDDEHIFEMLVVPPAPLLPSRPIPPRMMLSTSVDNSIPTSTITNNKNIDNNNVWTNKHDIGNSSIASVNTFDSNDNRTIPSTPFLRSNGRVNSATGPITSSTNDGSPYAFRAVPPPMPPPDDTYPDDPFDCPLPPAPLIPSRPLPPSGPRQSKEEEEEEEEDHPQNLVLIPLGR